VRGVHRLRAAGGSQLRWGAVPSSSSSTGTTVAAAGFDQRTDAVIRALSLFGVLPGMIVAVVVAILVSPVVGLLAVVVVAGGWALAVRLRARSALDRALAAVGATRMDPDEFPRWANVVDGLSLSSGVADTELWLVGSDGANGMAVASNDRSAIAVTRGLVESLSVIELEGIAANLLGRIKDGSARYGTVAFGLLGGMLGSVEAAGRVVADGLGEQRSVHADLVAVGMTRYPPGLAAALEHLERIGTTVPGAVPATAHLWVASTSADDAGVDPAIAATALQPLAYRIAVLGEL
jgi:heat shock protein HtpX